MCVCEVCSSISCSKDMLRRYLLVDLSIDMWLEILIVLMYSVLYYSLILVKICMARNSSLKVLSVRYENPFARYIIVTWNEMYG
jgi:uncharacterized membrane protein YccC